MNDSLQVKDDGFVRTLTLNRPERRNAIDSRLNDRLLEEFSRAEASRDVRAVIVTGVGPAFCAGSDLVELDNDDADNSEVFSSNAAVSRSIFEYVLRMRTPVIAALNGHAVAGGLELALASDIRVGVPNSKFGMPEAKIGMGAAFAAVLLPRIVPRSVALRMLLTGEYLDSNKALEVGLLDELVPAEELESHAFELASTIAANAPLTIARIKATINATSGLPLQAALALDLDPNPYLSEDRKEGIQAQLEGRSPVWKGK